MNHGAFGGGFPPAERTTVREALRADREATAAQIARLIRDWEGIVESSALVAVDDEHDPEGATVAFERAQVQGLLERARRRVTELDRALVRLDEGSYGVCEVCRRPIATERLVARPAATTCIRCAAG